MAVDGSYAMAVSGTWLMPCWSVGAPARGLRPPEGPRAFSDRFGDGSVRFRQVDGRRVFSSVGEKRSRLGARICGLKMNARTGGTKSLALAPRAPYEHNFLPFLRLLIVQQSHTVIYAHFWPTMERNTEIKLSNYI